MYMCVGMFQCGSWKENDEIHEKKDDSVPLEYLFLHVCSGGRCRQNTIVAKYTGTDFQGTNK